MTCSSITKSQQNYHNNSQNNNEIGNNKNSVNFDKKYHNIINNSGTNEAKDYSLCSIRNNHFWYF